VLEFEMPVRFAEYAGDMILIGVLPAFTGTTLSKRCLKKSDANLRHQRSGLRRH